MKGGPRSARPADADSERRASLDDLEEILDRFVVYGRTTTSSIHSAPVANRSLPLVEKKTPTENR